MQESFNDAAQLERTVLAWNRSSLAIVANGALVARAGIERHVVPVTALGLLVVAAGAGVWLLSTAPSRVAAHVLADRRRYVGAAAAFAATLSLLDLAIVATS